MEFVVLTQNLDKAMRFVRRCNRRLKRSDSALQIELREKLRVAMGPLLGLVKETCDRLELKHASASIDRIAETCSKHTYSTKRLQVSLEELGHLIQDELNDKVFMYVPIERAKYFDDQTLPFGQTVQDKFLSITGEIADANRCLGVGCPTAAVYHLMRVMEFGLKELAKRLILPGCIPRMW